MLNLLLVLLRGVGLGFAAGIPFGPVNAAVVDTSMRRCMRTAMAVGAGGAFVDFLYSQLAVLGIGRLLKEYPDLSTFLVFASGVVLVVYGIRTVKQPPLAHAHGGEAKPLDSRRAAGAFFAGVLLTLANPAALLSWVVLAGALLSDLTRFEALIAGVGIFVGVSLWFAGIGTLARMGRLRFGDRAVWLTRMIGAGIVVYGVFLVGKAGLSAWAMHVVR